MSEHDEAELARFFNLGKAEVVSPGCIRPQTASFRFVSISCQRTQTLLRSSRSIRPTVSRTETSPWTFL